MIYSAVFKGGIINISSITEYVSIIDWLDNTREINDDVVVCESERNNKSLTHKRLHMKTAIKYHMWNQVKQHKDQLI